MDVLYGCQNVFLFLEKYVFKTYSLAWSVSLYFHFVYNTANTVTPGGTLLCENKAVIILKLQESSNRALENTTKFICRVSVLPCQNLFQFLELVGFSKGTVAFNLYYWPFWGHEVTWSLHFLIPTWFCLDFFSLFNDEWNGEPCYQTRLFLFFSLMTLFFFFHINLILNVCAIRTSLFCCLSTFSSFLKYK